MYHIQHVNSMSTTGSENMEEEEIDESLLDRTRRIRLRWSRRTRRPGPAPPAKTTAQRNVPIMQDCNAIAMSFDPKSML